MQVEYFKNDKKTLSTLWSEVKKKKTRRRCDRPVQKKKTNLNSVTGGSHQQTAKNASDEIGSRSESRRRNDDGLGRKDSERREKKAKKERERIVTSKIHSSKLIIQRHKNVYSQYGFRTHRMYRLLVPPVQKHVEWKKKKGFDRQRNERKIDEPSWPKTFVHWALLKQAKE